MIIEASILIIAIAFVVLVIFLITTLIQAKKTMILTRRDLHHLSAEAIVLMRKLDALSSDLKSKADSLNFVFRPFKAMNKEKSHKEPSDTVLEVVEWISTSLVLFEKIKAAVRHYAK